MYLELISSHDVVHCKGLAIPPGEPLGMMYPFRGI